MIPNTLDRLTPFRAEASARDIPAEDVERWTALARPCATLTEKGDGPVVGRFGGPLLLPADAPEPVHPLVASIDLAALPAGATDLPLPPDGHLLLFAFPDQDIDDSGDLGSVVHVPADAAVVERSGHTWYGYDVDDYREVFEQFPQGPLSITADVSLPYHHLVELREKPWVATLPGHPRAEDLVDVWDDTCRKVDLWGSLQLGGYSNQEAVGTDPVATAVSEARSSVESGRIDWPVSGDVADWVLIADWHVDIEGLEGASVHWSIQREDLAARRFERTITTIYWNP